MRQPFACLCQQVGDVAPRFDTATATGLEDAQSGGVGRRALLGAGAVGDPPGDDGVTQGTLGFVVGGGQIGVGDEGGDGGPIVEDLAGECPNLLGLIVAVKLAGTWSETPAWYRTKLSTASDASIALSFSDVSDAHQFFTSPLRSSNNLDYRANPPHGRNTDIGCR